MNDRGARARFWFILTAVALAYLPSLGGGFLPFDDDWMVQNNKFYQQMSAESLLRLWVDLSSETRLLLGAEYLPVRDMTVLLDVWTFGLMPQAMRAVNLGWYLIASAFCVLSWRRILGSSWRSDFLAAFFLFHPVHTESVAWITGRKDVVGLAFFWLAFWMHTGTHRHKASLTSLFLMLAQLSKFLFVTAPLLLIATDLLRGVKITARTALRDYAPASVICLVVAGFQVHIARSTTMIGDPELDSLQLDYAQRVLTMGPVWWGYLKSGFLGIDLNVMHDVVPMRRATLAAVVPYFLSALSIAASIWGALICNSRAYFVGICWFFLPLLPVSQLLLPIQNFHADRYLLLSVMGSGLILATAMRDLAASQPSLLRSHPLKLLLVLVSGIFLLLTGYRAYLFSQPVLLFAHATDNSSHASTAPYQLGRVYEAMSKPEQAIAAYHLALMRPDMSSESSRRATNNLAKVYEQANNHSQAERVLRRGLELWPEDPKILGNLAEVVWRSGRKDEARALYEALVQRYPSYEVGRLRYLSHFGS